MASHVRDWQSLGPQCRLATGLFGETGEGRVAAWLDIERGRIGDADFARLFSDNVELPGVASLDYAHRMVRTRAGSLIGGIRYYGRDVTRPFVEIIAHDFDNRSALGDAVAGEWRAFSPPCMRLRRLPGEIAPRGSRLDASVHAGRYGEMGRGGGAVELHRFRDPDAAMSMVSERYEILGRDEPDLRRNVAPIERARLRELCGSGHLHAIRVDGRGIVGLIAAAPGCVDWIEGDEVVEEVVAHSHRGCGFAAEAQKALAGRRADAPETLLIGTIDGLNTASRRSAERAGRGRVMEYLFVPLGRSDH